MPAIDPRPLALSELVRSRLDELGLSYGEAGRRGDIPKATVANLATQPLRQVPRADTIIGLAKALQLPLRTVQETIATCVGLVYVEDRSDPCRRRVRAHIDLYEQLSPEDQRMLTRLAKSIADSEHGCSGRRNSPRKAQEA